MSRARFVDDYFPHVFRWENEFNGFADRAVAAEGLRCVMRSLFGLLPLLHLGHMYFDSALKIERLRLYKSRTALIASDHLPLIADFGVQAGLTPQHQLELTSANRN